MEKQIKIESTLEHKKRQKSSLFYSSSAVFFVINNPAKDIKTEISFLNHFLLKRDIKKVNAKISLRDFSGNLIDKYFLDIEDPSTFSLDPCQNIDGNFEGSVYISFSSKKNLGVPFCAVIGSIKTKDSVCSIHTYGRRLEEIENNTKLDLPQTKETGWTMRDSINTKSFSVFHNGKYASDLTFIIEVTNHKGKTFSKSYKKQVDSFATEKIIPQKLIPGLIKKLDGHYGHGKISIFGLKGVFPRMMCGNFIHNDINDSIIDSSEIQFTHTNFDFGELKQPDAKGDFGFFNHPYLPNGNGIFYPVNTQKQISIMEEKYKSNSYHEFNIQPFQQVKIYTKNEKLPSRFVGASIGIWPNSKLESECSTGIIVEDYIMFPCHWHWGLVKPGFEKGNSIISIFIQDFHEKNLNERMLNLKYFDNNGLLFNDNINIAENTMINTNDILNLDNTEGAVWYVLSGEKLEDLSIFSTFLPDQKAGSSEHAF